MRRFFRHIQVFVVTALLVTSSIWLALPKDICLTKLMVAEGCGCAAAAAASTTCPCCAASNASGILGCGDDHDGETSHETQHQPNCLLISSDTSKFNGADRVQPAAPTFDVVAVLPVSLYSPSQFVGHAKLEVSDNDALNHLHSYRENCALLI